MSLKRPFVPKSDVKQWFTTTTYYLQIIYVTLWHFSGKYRYAINYYPTYPFKLLPHPVYISCHMDLVVDPYVILVNVFYFK